MLFRSLQHEVAQLHERVTANRALHEAARQHVEQTRSRRIMARALDRYETDKPPALPPSLRCPRCDQRLEYLKSFVGGVNARQTEQWDAFRCAGGCGDFEYRQRTRKLRAL